MSMSRYMIGVRRMPERDVESLGVIGWALDAARRFFRRRRRRRRPPKGVFGNYRFPLFSDTYERSRRNTAGKLLAISLRCFFVFTKMLARREPWALRPSARRGSWPGPGPLALGPGPGPFAKLLNEFVSRRSYFLLAISY